MKDIYEILNGLGLAYKKYEHPPVFTVEEASKVDRAIDAAKSKNLFLRNKKGSTYYLVVVEASKKVDLKALAVSLNESKLSFGSPERLFEYLKLTPGSVSPFGLINDTNRLLTVIVDEDLLAQKKVSFHPNINTATLVLTAEDFIAFLKHTGHNYVVRKL